MKTPSLLLLSVFLTAPFAGAIGGWAHAHQPGGEPFVPVAANYDPSEPVRPRDAIAREFDALRSAGFNSVSMTVQWRDVELERGQYTFETVDRLFDIAGESGLRVFLEIATVSAPDWVSQRYPDGRFTPASQKPSGTDSAHACLDHPGVRADAVAFVRAFSEHISRHRSWYGVDVGSDLPQQQCVCPSSRKRFDDWLKSSVASGLRSSKNATLMTEAFLADRLADDLKLLTEATTGRGLRPATSYTPAPSVLHGIGDEPPVQDDWLMSRIVSLYGTSMRSYRATTPGSQLGLAFDGLRSAVGEHGWWLAEGPSSRDSAEVKLLAWTAIARGARALSLEPSTDASRLAAIVTRNPALFAPLRPRPSKAAIVFQPQAPDRSRRIYEALFAANIQADFIPADEIARGAAARYKIVFLAESSTLTPSAADALKAFAAAGGHLVDRQTETLTAQQIAQFATSAGATPDVRIDSAQGLVETRFLESAQVIMLVGLNHASTPQRVTMTFTPDTQEAIWQNMITGTAVNFVAGRDGPTYTHAFGARDALVLIIRKDIRVP